VRGSFGSIFVDASIAVRRRAPRSTGVRARHLARAFFVRVVVVVVVV
jgi:hypothetical protein